jgi:hypothetical protein
MPINDILSVYRQSLASERQSQLAQQQMALQALQFEAQQGFRESGRQREDTILALTEARDASNKALTSDANSIGFKLSSLPEIINAKRDSEQDFKNPDKIVEALHKNYKFSLSESRNIFNVVNYYELAQKNPKLAGEAEKASVNLGIQVAGHYDAWERAGGDQETLKKLPFLNALNESGILNLEGDDPLPRQQSADIFMGVAQATSMKQNISNEYAEIAKQDYEVQRPITEEAFEGDMNLSGEEALDFESLANTIGAFYGLGSDTETEVSDDINVVNASIVESLDFLSDDKKDKTLKSLNEIENKINKKTEKLNPLIKKRDESLLVYDSKEKEVEWLRKQKKQASKMRDSKLVKDYDSQIKVLSKQLKNHAEHKAFSLLEPQAGEAYTIQTAYRMENIPEDFTKPTWSNFGAVIPNIQTALMKLDEKISEPQSDTNTGIGILKSSSTYKIYKLTEEIKLLNEQKDLIGAQ